MGKKRAESKTFNIFLAILIAIGLWIYVTTIVSDEISTTLSNVPVTVLGEEVLTGKGLMIDPGAKMSISVRLIGSRTALANMTTENVSVTVNAATVAVAGEATLPCTITLPNSISITGVRVEGKNEQTLSVLIAKRMEKTLEVRGVFSGTVPEGYRTNDFEISPATIQVQGSETIVSKLDYVRVTVGGDNLAKTFSGELGFDYISTDGKKIDVPDVHASADKVNVILPVVMTKTVELTAELTDGGGATKENTTVTISPTTIQVSGGEEDVKALGDKPIILGVIDLARVTDTATYRFPVVLAPELTNDSGTSEAVVTVTVSGLASKTLEASNIEMINVPAPFTASAVTKSLQVRLRGPETALGVIASYQIRIVVDLKDQTLTRGQFRFPAKIYLDGNSGCGVVGGDYFIVVDVQ